MPTPSAQKACVGWYLDDRQRAARDKAEVARETRDAYNHTERFAAPLQPAVRAGDRVDPAALAAADARAIGGAPCGRELGGCAEDAARRPAEGRREEAADEDATAGDEAIASPTEPARAGSKPGKALSGATRTGYHTT